MLSQNFSRQLWKRCSQEQSQAVSALLGHYSIVWIPLLSGQSFSPGLSREEWTCSFGRLINSTFERRKCWFDISLRFHYICCIRCGRVGWMGTNGSIWRANCCYYCHLGRSPLTRVL